MDEGARKLVIIMIVSIYSKFGSHTISRSCLFAGGVSQLATMDGRLLWLSQELQSGDHLVRQSLMTVSRTKYYTCIHVRGTVNPVLLAAATITVVCSQNEDENAKVGVRL